MGILKPPSSLLSFKTIFIEVRFTKHKTNHSKSNNSVSYSTFTMLCNHYLDVIPEDFHYPKGNSIPIKHLLPLPSPPGLVNHQSGTVSMDLTTSDSPHKRTTYCLSCLASFSQHVVLRITHIMAHIRTSYLFVMFPIYV